MIDLAPQYEKPTDDRVPWTDGRIIEQQQYNTQHPPLSPASLDPRLQAGPSFSPLFVPVVQAALSSQSFFQGAHGFQMRDVNFVIQGPADIGASLIFVSSTMKY
jgi:hypothetical protein